MIRSFESLFLTCEVVVDTCSILHLYSWVHLLLHVYLTYNSSLLNPCVQSRVNYYFSDLCPSTPILSLTSGPYASRIHKGQ
jgi:hypothetical protein